MPLKNIFCHGSIQQQLRLGLGLMCNLSGKFANNYQGQQLIVFGLAHNPHSFSGRATIAHIFKSSVIVCAIYIMRLYWRVFLKDKILEGYSIAPLKV